MLISAARMGQAVTIAVWLIWMAVEAYIFFDERRQERRRDREKIASLRRVELEREAAQNARRYAAT